jgi:hypothetical protein
VLDPRDYRSFTSRRQHFDADTNGQDDLNAFDRSEIAVDAERGSI